MNYEAMDTNVKNRTHYYEHVTAEKLWRFVKQHDNFRRECQRRIIKHPFKIRSKQSFSLEVKRMRLVLTASGA